MSRIKRKRRGKHSKKHNYKHSYKFLIPIFIVAVMLLFTASPYSYFRGSLAAIINPRSSLINKETKNSINNKQDINKKKENDFSLDNCLFLGDSYTVLLEDTIKKTAPNALIFGEVGVQPNYWNEEFPTLPDNENISGVVLLIGVNGVTFSNNISDKEKLIDSLVEKYKDKTIYVEKVFPVGTQFQKVNPVTFNDAIENHNKEIKKYCEKYPNVKFIDTTTGFVTKDGYLTNTKDGLHIRGDHQELFYENIVDAVN
ncbi:MAG: hypothetical protein RR712_01245 [Terrisporobacter sp.]